VGGVGTACEVAGIIREIVEMQNVLVASDDVSLRHLHSYCCFIAGYSGFCMEEDNI